MNSESKEDYSNHLKGLSGKQLEQQLTKDAASLNSVLDSLKGFQFYYMIGFGIGGGDEGTFDAGSAPAFVLPQKDSIEEDFNHLDRKLYFEQTIALPEPGFEFLPGYSQEAFRNIGVADLKIDVRKIYSKDQEVSSNDLKLARADSVQVQAVYRYPSQFDTLVIDFKEKKDVSYGFHTIELDRVGKRKISFSVPLQLSAKVLDYRGVTPDGVMIASNAFSKFPITAIDAGIEENLRSLSKAFTSKDKEKAIQQLEESPEQVLRYVQQLAALQKDFSTYEKTEFEDDFEELDVMKTWVEKYQDVLNVNTMQYEISFPNEVTQIHLYIATAYDSISRDFVAVNTSSEPLEYDVYLDKSSNKYGIVHNGQIIIPAAYENLKTQNGTFFTERIKGDFFTYQLDVENKKLNKIPGNVTFYVTLDDDFYVFHNEDRYVGILDKNLKEVLPFRFDEAMLCGDLFVMTVSHRGRQYKEFYTKAGKQITIPEKITSADCGEGYVVLTTRDGISGAINKEGKLTVPLEYYIDAHYDRLSDKLVAYQTVVGTDATVGIINVESGEIIVPAENGFDIIGSFYEGLAPVDFMPGYQRQMGYINEKGETVIPAQFSGATPFYNGLACVTTADDKIHLINRKVQIIKTFPDREAKDGYSLENYGVQRMWKELVYYNINDKYYDHQGNPLAQEIIDQIENN